MRRYITFLTIAFLTFTASIIITKILRPNQISPVVAIRCEQGNCVIISPTRLETLPTITFEQQPDAPLRLFVEPASSSSLTPHGLEGIFVLQNLTNKPVESYQIKYEVSGNNWRNELFALVGTGTPNYLIGPNQTRPLMGGGVNMPAHAHLKLRLDYVRFTDGTWWRNKDQKVFSD
jgi:hypothetical protein